MADNPFIVIGRNEFNELNESEYETNSMYVVEGEGNMIQKTVITTRYGIVKFFDQNGKLLGMSKQNIGDNLIVPINGYPYEIYGGEGELVYKAVTNILDENGNALSNVVIGNETKVAIIATITRQSQPAKVTFGAGGEHQVMLEEYVVKSDEPLYFGYRNSYNNQTAIYGTPSCTVVDGQYRYSIVFNFLGAKNKVGQVTYESGWFDIYGDEGKTRLALSYYLSIILYHTSEGGED